MGSRADAQGLACDASLDVSVVVPHFNTAGRVRETVDELVGVLGASGLSYEVIAVSDGTTDGSEHAVVPLGAVRTIAFADNRGKGAALRAGFETARGRYVGFIDGDGDIPAAELTTLLDATRPGDGAAPDVVVGSKLHPASRIDYPLVRRLYSWAWQQLVRALFGLHVRDTQTGIKLVRRTVLADVLPRTLERRYALDLELLVVAHHLGYRRIVEVPVRIRTRRSSTVSVSVAAQMLADMLAIVVRLRVRRAYDTSGPRSPLGPKDARHTAAAPARPASPRAADSQVDQVR